MPTRCLRSVLLAALALCVLSPVAAGQADAPPADSAALAVPDSLAGADSLGAGILTLSDSAEAARLDSAAVAALADTTARVADAVAAGVDVSLLGRVLFQIYGGLGDISPDVRAERLSDRLADLAQSGEIAPDSLRIVDGKSLSTIQIRDVIVMTVTDADAAALGLLRPEAAVAYRAQIVDGVAQYREQATFTGVLWGLGWSALALLVYLLALRALKGAYGWADGRTLALRRRYLRGIKLGTLEVVGKDQVARAGRALVNLSRLIVSVLLFYVFLTFVFGQFAWTQGWANSLLEAALTPLRQLADVLLGSVDNVIAILVIIVVVRYIIRISDYLFDRVSRGEAELTGFHADLADPTRKIVKFILVAMGVMLIYPYTPIANNRGFQGLTVFFGLLISLGSSTAISNMVAGIVLTYTRAFRIGDRVRVGDAFGDVVERNFLVTRIRTTKNEDISVPNANVLSNQIVNYSAMAREGSGVILHTEVTIGYDVPWPRVHQLLIAAAKRTAGVEADPSPFVLQTGLGDFSVAYQLNAYTKEVTRMARLYSDMHQHIQDQFAEAEIEILSPTYGAYREGPSTLPDVDAIHDWRTRRAVAAPKGATDGADAAPEPEAPAADIPPVELPSFLTGKKEGEKE